MQMIALIDWRGTHDDAKADPASMQFTTRPAKSCKGCIFEKQRVSVCRKAADAAALAGLADCDTGVIYILRAQDPRQLDLVEDV